MRGQNPSALPACIMFLLVDQTASHHRLTVQNWGTHSQSVRSKNTSRAELKPIANYIIPTAYIARQKSTADENTGDFPVKKHPPTTVVSGVSQNQLKGIRPTLRDFIIDS